MRFLFKISVEVDSPILVGQDKINGRRQLIPILRGELNGEDMMGNIIKGKVLKGGVDSQIIRPDGKCELSARYGVLLEDGRSFYIENNGIRTVPDTYIENVLRGEFIDPKLYYFCTTPTFEVYSESLEWLEKYVFVCRAIRRLENVEINFYVIE